MKLELEFTPTGSIRSHYSDEKSEVLQQIAKEAGSKMTVKRASNVEWEELEDGRSGWTVRAAWNPNLAIRWNGAWVEVSNIVADEIMVFNLRDEALSSEIAFFWDLLPKE